ncbi:MAG TPA: hypothetical protein VFL47_00070 [Flavisolibacter sp.]|nr:hypothetical protein [Flavisolibacter sp.]
MATTAGVDSVLQFIREHRSSEGNFDVLQQQLEKAIESARQQNETGLAEALQEVKEKYATAYQKAKETGGSAWPEFEKFVTQFELALTGAS